MTEVNTAFLDATIALANQRAWFNVQEVEELVKGLRAKDIENDEITRPLVERVRLRTAVDAMFVLNTFLDLRNSISPPKSLEAV